MPKPSPVWLGNQTSYAAATLLTPFEYALAQGFDAFEWFPDKKPDGMGWSATDLTIEQRLWIRQVSREHGIRLSVHAQAQVDSGAILGPGRFSQDIELAMDLGAEVINVHLPTLADSAFRKDETSELIQDVAGRGMKLVIENTPADTPQKFNELFAQWRAWDLPQFEHAGMCFDLGHANLCPATRNDYLRYLDQLAPQVPLSCAPARKLG